MIHEHGTLVPYRFFGQAGTGSRVPAARNDVLAQLGQRIREARCAAGLTQEAAADAAGLDWRRWQRLEGGTVNPTVKTLTLVARAVGLSFWQLMARPPHDGA